MMNKIPYYLCCLLLVTACKIENDIPYPIVDGSIQTFEVEGQCDANGNSGASATISATDRTVSLYVDDTVDLTNLRITRLTVSNEAALVVDSTVCTDYAHFPTAGFESAEGLSPSTDTRMNFSKPVLLTLRTYQDYVWRINVQQVLQREILLENQIGNAVIDDINRAAVIYVSKDQPLSRIHVSSFNLGGVHGSVTPDPTASETFDFSSPVTFQVRRGWEETSHEWRVFVYQTDEEATNSSGLFAMATRATLNGSVQNGSTVVVEYKTTYESNWSTATDVVINGISYTATLTGLTPGTDYQYRININGVTGATQTFSTAPATPLTDGDFDTWHLDGYVWNPWVEGGTSFWDTGNKGATTIGTSSDSSNSAPTTETATGSGQAASLESRWIVLKFAAGNIFTGTYVKTDGTNGVLSFGREFSSFPTKLRINYKYTSATIDRIGEDALSSLRGQPDSCHIYVALTDWDEPREIRTRPSERQLFDKTDPKIIAYAELIQGSSDSEYRQQDLVLDYRYTDRTPKYIVVVATASKYGDYFTGGVGSKLLLDNFELIYE